MSRRKLLIIAAILGIVMTGVFVSVYGSQQKSGSSTDRQSSESNKKTQSAPQTPPDTSPETTFDKSRYSIDDATSFWVVVNKKRALNPRDYVPGDLVVPDTPLRVNITADERMVRNQVAAALKSMFTAASAEGITLNVQSGYRSYGLQTSVYNRYVSQQGQAAADTQSARPGHSEHQTGLAVDVGGTTRPECNVESCFADTAEGKWVATHAHTHGFVVRYPSDKTDITGYMYEPWHLRYVGSELAAEMHSEGVHTLEEFFDLGAANDYN